MRSAPLAVVLLLVPALLAAAPPAATAAEAPLLTDAKGDTATLVALDGQVAPSVPFTGTDQSESTDLLGLEALEGDDEITFTVAVSSLKGVFTGSTYVVSFVWGERQFAAEANYYVFQGQTFEEANLFALDRDAWNVVAPLPLVVDAEGGRVSMTVVKVLLLDEARRTPNKGDSLTALRVDAVRAQNLELFVSMDAGVTDRMPDEPTAGASLTFQRGDEAAGALRLASDERVRVSNGGATTFVFRVTLRNLADAPDEVAVTLSALPEGWTGKVQSPVRVPAGGEMVVPVLASVPFAHEHGGHDAFVVEAKSGRDAGSYARMKLGVLHTPIPQPTGHHSEIYLHGRAYNPAPLDALFNYAGMWLSTDAAHDTDPKEIPPNDCPGDQTHGWNIPLDPGLQMGLDFDLERLGTLDVTLLPTWATAAKVTARVYLVAEDDDRNERNGRIYFDAEDATLLADAAPADVDLVPNQPVPLSFDLAPTPESDYIAYQPGQNVWVELRLREETGQFICSGVKSVPTLLTETFKLALPLDEYHDRLSGAAEAATSTLDLRARAAVEKPARPGTVMTYVFDLVNTGASSEAVILEVAGNDARIATLVPEGSVALAPGEAREVVLGVALPKDAAEGETFEVLVFAHAASDPSRSAIARTKTTVALGADALDDENEVLQAAKEAARKETPGAGLAALAAALAFALALRRRG